MKSLCSSAAVVALMAAGAANSPSFAAERHSLANSVLSAGQLFAQADQPSTDAPPATGDAAVTNDTAAAVGDAAAEEDEYDPDDPVDGRAIEALLKMGDELV